MSGRGADDDPEALVNGRRFSVTAPIASEEFLARKYMLDLTKEARDKGAAAAAHFLGKLADNPSLLKLLGWRKRQRWPRAHWIAYHALLCEITGVGDRERVANFWNVSSETVQDALTDWRGIEPDVRARIERATLDGFTPEEILASLEESLLTDQRERLRSITKSTR